MRIGLGFGMPMEYRNADGGGAGGAGGAGDGGNGGVGGGQGAGNAGGAGNQGGQTNAELETLRAQMAAIQAERDELKAARDKAEKEKLSEVDRLKLERDELAKEREASTNALRQARFESAITQAAMKAGILPEDAIVYVKPEYDKDGNPINVDKAIATLASSKPYLVQGAATGGSVSNGARTRTPGANTQFTRAQIADRKYWEANKPAILEAMREGRIDN